MCNLFSILDDSGKLLLKFDSEKNLFISILHRSVILLRRLELLSTNVIYHVEKGLASQITLTSNNNFNPLHFNFGVGRKLLQHFFQTLSVEKSHVKFSDPKLFKGFFSPFQSLQDSVYFSFIILKVR